MIFFSIFEKISPPQNFLLHTSFYEPWLYAKYQKMEQSILDLFKRLYTEMAATFTEKSS